MHVCVRTDTYIHTRAVTLNVTEYNPIPPNLLSTPILYAVGMLKEGALQVRWVLGTCLPEVTRVLGIREKKVKFEFRVEGLGFMTLGVVLAVEFLGRKELKLQAWV